MKIKIVKVVRDDKRGRVFFTVIVDEKRKSWNVAKGLFEVLKTLIHHF